MFAEAAVVNIVVETAVVVEESCFLRCLFGCCLVVVWLQFVVVVC